VGKELRGSSVEALNEGEGFSFTGKVTEALPRTARGASSSHVSVGRGGRSWGVGTLTDSTVNWRGSQKSEPTELTDSAVKAWEWARNSEGTGDGEGESEGQEVAERRSDVWLAVSDGGWMNTGGATEISLLV
jgi:hypothetical protein